MARHWLTFGTGKDGSPPTSGTYSAATSACAGTSGATALTGTTGSFTATDFVLIHQSRGSGAGNWEVNQITSDAGATLNLALPLQNTYTTSGNSRAQVIEMKEYTSGTISGTLTCSDWNGSINGILPILSNGTLTVTGVLDVDGKGHRGNTAGGITGASARQYTGEGSSGTWVAQKAANGSGGGGGRNETGSGQFNYTGGGGGGHGESGNSGGDPDVSNNEGDGAPATGNQQLTDMNFGGAGGRGGGAFTGSDGSDGGDGGGVILVFADRFTCSSGDLTSDGLQGESGVGQNRAGGAAGAGGSVRITTMKATIGTNKIDVLGGASIEGHVGNCEGGSGGKGRIAIYSCDTISGSISSSDYGTYYTEESDSQEWCQVFGGGIV